MSVTHARPAETGLDQPPKDVPLYRDIREYLTELDRRKLLIHVTRIMNKDTEVTPLVRWQFRGLEQSQRKGWLFENLTDCAGARSMDRLPSGLRAPRRWCMPRQWDWTRLTGSFRNGRTLKHTPSNRWKSPGRRRPLKIVVIVGSDIVASGGIDKFRRDRDKSRH